LAYDHSDWHQTLAARLDAELRHAHPRTVLEAAVETFGDRLALVSSFGAESAVLLDLAADFAGQHGLGFERAMPLLNKLGNDTARTLKTALDRL